MALGYSDGLIKYKSSIDAHTYISLISKVGGTPWEWWKDEGKGDTKQGGRKVTV